MYYLKILLLLVFISCLNSSKSFSQDIEAQKNELILMISELPEVTDSIKKIDSLKQNGVPIDFSIELIWEPPFELETQAGVALVFLNQILFGSTNKHLYFFRYDKLKKEILLIEKRKEVGISDI